jgi:F-type H+-transporting ATPase subunit delta
VARTAARSAGGYLDPVLSRRYAKALFAVALRRQAVDRVAEDMSSIVELLRREPRLKAFLLSPSVPAESVSALFQSALGPHVAPITGNFLQLLHKKGRFDHFEEITHAFIEQVEDSRGILKAVVTTAAGLDPVAETELKAALERVTGKSIRLESKIDPEVMGGVVVVLKDRLIDGSVRHGIERLREDLAAVAVI